MIRLSREIRFALVSRDVGDERPRNSWAGWPASNFLVPQLKLQLIVSGSPNPTTGYLCNIKVIDELLRAIVAELPVDPATPVTAESMLHLVTAQVQQRWSAAMSSPDSHASTPPSLETLVLHVSPFLNYRIQFQDPAMNQHATEATAQIVVTEQFEFSAAHRLHCDHLDDETNRRLFGKCNHPSGHGHNYVVEVSVAGTIDSSSGQVLPLDVLEETVKRLVIDRLDHKHLNRDVEYFAKINPSVENIAAAIFHWLDGQFEPASLKNVRVYETPKTWAEFGET